MATGSPLGSPKSSPTSPTTTSTITPCADYPRRASTASAFAKSAGQEAPLRLMGRRTTTRNLDVDQTEALAYDGDDNTPSKIGQYLHRVHSASVIARYALYILPVSMLLAVPMIVTANAPYRADGIRLLGLFIWIEIIWLTFWACRITSKAMPFVFQAACGLLSSGIRKYSLVLQTLEIPTSILLWCIIAFAATDVIFVFDKEDYHHQKKGQWVRVLKHLCQASIIAAAIFVVEKTIIQLISIAYYQKQYAHKIRESKRLIRLLDLLYDASRTLFPEFGREFAREDIEIHRETFIDLRAKMETNGISLGSKVLGGVHRVGDKVTAAIGTIASDVTGRHIANTSNAHSIVSKALETERASKALARRLFSSLCSVGQEAIYKQDILEVLGPGREADSEEIFNILDRDGNGDVSVEVKN
ncbi:Mechanosensitive ion channel protein [Sphaerulina musiva]